MEPIIKNDVPPTEEKDKEGEERYRFTDEKNLKRVSINSAGQFWFIQALVALTMGLLFREFPAVSYSRRQEAR